MAHKNEDKAESDDDFNYQNSGLFGKWKYFLRNITVEPVVFFYSLGFSITMLPSYNLYFEKTCTVSDNSFINVPIYLIHISILLGWECDIWKWVYLPKRYL